MTTERVDNLEKKIELGLSGGAHQRETCAMRNGHCCSRKSRVMDRVMQKFSEECKRKINVEDTHTIHSYELFNALQQVLHGVDAVEGSTQGAVENQVQEKGVDLDFNEIGIEGVVR